MYYVLPRGIVVCGATSDAQCVSHNPSLKKTFHLVAYALPICKMVRTVALLALAASATAFAPQQQAVRGASSLSACAAGVSLFRPARRSKPPDARLAGLL